MAIFLKKDFQPENFYECNQALANQVTEVCDLKQAVFSAKMKFMWERKKEDYIWMMKHILETWKR